MDYPPSPEPHTVEIELTNHCSARCSFCPHPHDLPPWIVPIPKVRISEHRKGAEWPGSDTQRSRSSDISVRQRFVYSEGKTVGEVSRELGVSEQTYYRWRKEYGGMEVDQVRRLKELEQENGRLKRLVADQALDISILKEVSRGNF